VERRLQQKANKATVSRADAALSFLRSVPEVKEKKWTMAQFDTVWHQLVLYVKDGSPSGLSNLDLTRDYKGTTLRREVMIQMMMTMMMTMTMEMMLTMMTCLTMTMVMITLIIMMVMMMMLMLNVKMMTMMLLTLLMIMVT